MTAMNISGDSSVKSFFNLPGWKVLFHLLFWAGSFLFLLAYFSHDNEYNRVDKVYVFLFHLPLIAAVYINLLVFIPFILRRGSRIAYVLAIALHLAFMSGTTVWFMEHAPGILFPDYFIISNLSFLNVLPFVFFYLLLTTLLEMSRAWFVLSAAEKKLAETEKEKIRAELESLRAQINPHFLFNSLNSLYALALEGSERTPGLILKLSEMLRYLLYRCSEEKVSLEGEIQFLQDYISLQAIRSEAGRKIIFEVPDFETGLEISPFLLNPLVENVFKHGENPKQGEAFAEIRIQLQGNRLDFFTSNAASGNRSGNIREQEHIGLSNVTRRLNLLYPGRHHFSYGLTEGQFLVHLNIQL